MTSVDELLPDVSELATRARNGDRAAFGTLVKRFQNAGYATALSVLQDPAEAQDALQDAFVTAYCRLRQLREPAAFGGWLRSIVAAQSRDHLRQRCARQRHVDGAMAQVPPERRAAQPAQSQRLEQHQLWEAVFGLPEPHR